MISYHVSFHNIFIFSIFFFQTGSHEVTPSLLIIHGDRITSGLIIFFHIYKASPVNKDGGDSLVAVCVDVNIDTGCLLCK